MSVRSTSVLCVALLVFGSTATANELTTVRLAHRTSDELVAMIRPLLEPGETVAAGPGMIIIKAASSRAEEIESLIKQLDTRAHRLEITVAHGRGLDQESLSGLAPAAGNVGTANAIHPGHFYSTESQSTRQNLQRMQILDGKPAHISIGSEQPVPTQIFLALGPNGHIATGQSTGYLDITSGFDALPHLVGNDVILDISPWADRLNRQGDMGVNVHEANTTIRLPIGTWVELGGQVSESAGGRMGTGGHTYSTKAEQYRVFVRVDDLDSIKQ